MQHRVPGVQDATIAAVLPGGFERISLSGLGAPGVTSPDGQHLFSADWNIVAGTSNWGAYALAAAVALLRGNPAAIAPFDSRQRRAVVEHMVLHGPAVDGVTRRQEPTVDGLPFLTYLQPWQAIRSKLGLAE